MNVSVVWEIVPWMLCEHCFFMWEANIETSQIDWDTVVEVRLVSEIECPHCGSWTPVTRDEDNLLFENKE